jgi:3-oxoacyl-[acyl-carrier-protein] synthase III
MHTIRLVRAAVSLAPGTEDAASIAQASGLPLTVVSEKMGIKSKRRADADLHPSQMAVDAGRLALDDIDPLSVDAVIWTGSEYKDHIVWTAAIHVQRELGLKNAYAFDLSARCSTGILGMKVAASMMQTDPALKRVLLVGGHKTGDLVNYQDPNTRFLYNLADGGSAMLLERDDAPSARGAVLEGSSVITDGAFSMDVVLPAGGTRVPTRAPDNAARTYLTVPDPEGMKQRLDAVSLQNFLTVIRRAAGEKPIDYLALLHMKRSAHDAILKELGLSQEQSIYLDTYGHFGSPDQVLSLGLAEQRGLLKPGARVVMASAGLGYMWAAIALEWHKPTFGAAALRALSG